MQKLLIIIFSFMICFSMTGCNNSNVEKDTKKFIQLVENLFNDYKLDDAKLTVEKAKKTEDYYISSFTINSEDFTSLSGTDAFHLIQKLDNLGEDLKTLFYLDKIKSKDYIFSYDKQQSNGGVLHYLMVSDIYNDYDKISTVTVRDNNILYDTFTNKEYVLDLKK